MAQSFNLDFSKVEVSQVRKPVAGRVISDQRLVDSLAQITGRTTESVRDALQGLSDTRFE